MTTEGTPAQATINHILRNEGRSGCFANQVTHCGIFISAMYTGVTRRWYCHVPTYTKCSQVAGNFVINSRSCIQLVSSPGPSSWGGPREEASIHCDIDPTLNKIIISLRSQCKNKSLYMQQHRCSHTQH